MTPKTGKVLILGDCVHILAKGTEVPIFWKRIMATQDMESLSLCGQCQPSAQEDVRYGVTNWFPAQGDANLVMPPTLRAIQGGESKVVTSLLFFCAFRPSLF